ncbi:MAG: helix-turn-helix domain-containing protein [Gemmatimonadota bacterium]
MRLETCIRKGLPLKAPRVREVREEAGHLIAEIDWIKGRQLSCTVCSRRTGRIHGRQAPRTWRDLRIRDPDLVLRYAPRRIRCPACGPRVEHLPWAAKWQGLTRWLSLAIARLSRCLSWKETATHFGVDWKTVAAAVRGAVERGLKLRVGKPLHILGIDEVSPMSVYVLRSPIQEVR